MELNASRASADAYIRANWQKTVRISPSDEGTIIGLPFPYTVPSIKDAFQELYYWDTYYTNLGLIAHGLVGLAKNNADNCLHLVNRFGYVPNGNRIWYLARSQPPHLSMMVRDVFDVTGDVDWLHGCIPGLRKEYDFWMLNRIAPQGLNRYYYNPIKDDLLDMYNFANTKRFRINARTDDERRRWGMHLHAECESGWDFTPRFENRCADCLAIDLNANLYQYEINFAHFSRVLGLGEDALWEDRALRRRQLMDRYLWDHTRQCYFDYLFTDGRFCRLISAAVFYPLWAGCASPEQAAAVVAKLPLLEQAHGLAACESSPQTVTFQWDFPNGWAPLHYACIKGLERYGYHEHARRIAEKYLALVAAEFERTGDLWEKYDVVKGTSEAAAEYGTPALMGWTAGVFAVLLRQQQCIQPPDLG